MTNQIPFQVINRQTTAFHLANCPYCQSRQAVMKINQGEESAENHRNHPRQSTKRIGPQKTGYTSCK